MSSDTTKRDTRLETPQPPTKQVPIIAIGASAGGLEAVTELLQHLSPATGFAYVYIQHLDPDHQSHLSNILGRATAMPVQEAEHLVPIEPDHVYIIPPDKSMEVVDGVLTLEPRPNKPAGHMPIDQFFVSLADRQKEGAIGVLLSGTANDGTVGLRAIKVAGGITFAQDETARFQSMPKSAISEGVVDKVLRPSEIAQELEQLSRQPTIFQQTQVADQEEQTDDDEDLKSIIQFLRRAVGVDFGHYKMTTIRRRVIRRMLLFKLETLSEYYQYLKLHAEEIGLLYNDLLINVTTFFRDEEVMVYLKKELFPRIIKDKGPRESLRIWIPACSTGQEAYSLAIVLLEVLGDQASNRSIQIFATDLSETAVAKARLGSYTRGEVIDVSPKRLQRFFTKVDDHYRINRAVRDLCVFAPQNILRDPPFSRMDLISCRNLLIYLDSVFQRKAIAMFHYALNPTGYLLLGKSETVGAFTQLFTQLEKTFKVYARKNDVPSRATFDMPPPQLDSEPPEEQPSGAFSPNTPARVDPTNDLDKMVDDLLLRQYVPASVVVNQDLDIIQFRGSTGLFLEPSPGKASLNLLKMARPSLVFELRNAVNKARKSDQSIRKTGLEVKTKNQTHQVAIEAIPLKTGTEEKLVLIVFEETVPPIVLPTDVAEARNRRIKQLEDELATLREDMRSIIEEQEASTEELQSANEEIISSNEELQSINEELETSKEEIESSNEELLTINQELQVRNDQLSEANEFSTAIFSTIRESMLVLDKDLRVRKANQTFYKLFRVSEDDIEGRLVYELGNGQWDVPQLRTLLTDVIARATSIESFEIDYTFPDIGKKVLLLNARRVVRNEEAILLAIEDITDHRLAQQFLEEREAWLHALIDNAPVLIWVSGPDGGYTFFNKAWLDYTGCTLEEALREDWSKNIHPDDQESYEANYQDAYRQRRPFQAEYRLKRSDGEYRWMLVNAKPTYSTQGTFDGYVGTCAEIYNRRTITQLIDLRALQRTQKIIEMYAEIERIQREVGQAGLDPKLQRVAWQKLEDTQEQLRALIETTPDVITRWDTDLKLIFANSAFESKTGVSNESLLGKTNQEMGQPVEIAVPYMGKLRQVIKTGLPQSHYNSFPTPNGLAYFYSSMFPEVEAEGSVKSVLAIARDITDLKLVEEIQQTAKNLQAVLDSSPTAIGLFKAVRDEQYQVIDFHLVVCNNKFADMLGQPGDALLGQPVAQLSDELWGENTFDELLRVLTTGEPAYKEEYKEARHQQSPADPERTEEAAPSRCLGMSLTQHDEGVVLTALDITALKRAEQEREYWLNQLDQSQATLQALDQMRQQVRERGEFLRTTTHDLRGSFGVIQGAASLLQMMDTEEEREQMLAMLQRNLVQVTQLLTQLLDYSRLEAGQEVVDVVDFDASALLNQLSESLQPLAEERGLTIKTDGPRQLPVAGDPVKVQRIVQNLMLNALKYTRKGEVSIRWQADESGWVLQVADTGPGLPSALARQLMDESTTQAVQPDVQSSVTKTEASGEGIGLFIVKRLVALLGARLLVDSQEGVGTRFDIYFPEKI